MKIAASLLLILSLAACSQGPGTRMVRAPSSAPQVGKAERAGTPAARYIALSHTLRMQVPAEELQARFQAMQAECVKLACEILSITSEAGGRNSSASATLVARVPPAAFERFFADTQAQGKLISHVAQADDLTADVIDVEARIKNLEAFKARVMELLAKRAATLKETLEAEQQLAATQTELDSIREKRRQLANRTDMVRVEIAMVASWAGSDGGWSAPIASALGEAGNMLSYSLAGLITFLVAALPWVVAGWLLVWLPARRVWRRRKLNAAKGADPAR